MSRNLELRSTFQFSGEGLGTLAQPKEKILSPLAPSPAEAPESINKNNFGIATLISKSICSSMDEEMISMFSSYTSKRLSSVINKGFGNGEEQLSIRSTAKELEKFEFNADNPFSSGVNSKFCLREGSHKGHVILHVPAFIPEKDLNVPADATNFKICARLISVSDFERNGEQATICNKAQHNKVGTYETTMLPVLRIPTQPLTAQLAIPNVIHLHSDVSTVLVIGIKFYSYKNSKFSFMPESGMMKIVTVG